MAPQPSSSKPWVLNTSQPDQPQGREQSQCSNRYSDDSNLLQPHLRAAWNRIKVVTRILGERQPTSDRSSCRWSVDGLGDELPSTGGRSAQLSLVIAAVAQRARPPVDRADNNQPACGRAGS